VAVTEVGGRRRGRRAWPALVSVAEVGGRGRDRWPWSRSVAVVKVGGRGWSRRGSVGVVEVGKRGRVQCLGRLAWPRSDGVAGVGGWGLDWMV